jgi:4-hydroxyphenylpyruvate dioxygenase
MAVQQEEATGTQDDVFAFEGIDYVELYVGNAYQAAHFYRTIFGFTPIGYAGVETGVTDRTSFILQQGDIRLIVTSSLRPDHPAATHVMNHGDSVKDIAFSVRDARRAFEVAVARGAQPVLEPTVFERNGRQVVKATIATFGETVHSFVQDGLAHGGSLPGFRPIRDPLPTTPTGLVMIDHVAVCLDQGTLEQWVSFYQRVLDFHTLHDQAVETEFSAMNSAAVESRSGGIKFPLMEPAPSKRVSQIEEFLGYHQGPGAQHLAVLTNDIVALVRELRRRGVEFRATPGAYYDHLSERVGPIAAEVDALREQHILVDRDDEGYLLQIFAKPMQGRPTLFCELIQRAGAQGFGYGNIKALFESIEREQLLREQY